MANMKTVYDIGAAIPSKSAFSKRMMFLFMSLIFASVALFFLALPEYKKMQIMRMEIDLKEKNINLKKDVIGKVVNFNKSSEDLKDSDLDKVNDLMPYKSKAEEYVANIDNLVKINRLLMEKIEVAPDNSKNVLEDENSPKKNNVTIVINGDFVSFMSFLRSFERSIPLADINRLIIDKDRDKKKITYNITFSYNYR